MCSGVMHVYCAGGKSKISVSSPGIHKQYCLGKICLSPYDDQYAYDHTALLAAAKSWKQLRYPLTGQWITNHEPAR
jgi:hypothetical protein